MKINNSTFAQPCIFKIYRSAYKVKERKRKKVYYGKLMKDKCEISQGSGLMKKIMPLLK